MKLHLNLLHPINDKLLKLPRRANPMQTNENVRQILKRISQACEHCRESSPSQMTFRALLLTDRILLNHEIAMDLMRIEGVAILHVVDGNTVLRGKSPVEIWLLFVKCLASVYSKYPAIIRLNQEVELPAQSF